MRKPKGIKGHRQKLFAEQCRTAAAMKRGMLEASRALDEQAQEIVALKRILISERAQIIYYTEKYSLCLKHECFDMAPIGFLDLPEPLQEAFIKRAVSELQSNQGIVPHDPEAAAAQKQMQTIGRKLIVPGEPN